MKFVAVSSCPTGIAHTYMAAEALEQAAKAAGHEIQVETQGAAGSTALDPGVIAEADGVVFAADLEVKGRERFAGKPTVDVGVKKAVHDPGAVIAEAVRVVETAPAPAAAGGTAPVATAAAEPATKVTADAGVGTRIRQWLMTGVSYMIPFVAAGGILIALSFIIGGYDIVDVPLDEVVTGFAVTSAQSWGALFFHVGNATFSFLVAVLAGFIAYAIADRPGLAPGFTGGALAVMVDAGFLGGLAAGFIAGFMALGISRIPVPKGVRGVMPVVVTPLVATLGTGFLMLVAVGPPLAAASEGLTSWLNGMSGGSLILLGVILGLMMAFDMGGPVNKVAYAFATTGITAIGTAASVDATEFRVMAAVMAAGMTPPLGLALATVVRPRAFTTAERENGKAAWLLGASFITEGAIPFAAADPLRIIPSLMIGSAATGGLVMAFGSGLRAPHGGIWVTGLISQPFLYLLAVVIGTAITAGSVLVAKRIGAGSATAVLDRATA